MVCSMIMSPLLNKPCVNEIILKEQKLTKNAASLIVRDSVNREGLDLSKEILRVSVGQRAEKLLSVKFEGMKKKKFCHSARVEPTRASPKFESWMILSF